jgi:glycerol-3-phosphate dehydrogenase
VAGGKYTTYRVMAKDAVDAAVQDLPTEPVSCSTARTPLVGAQGYRELVGDPDLLADKWGLTTARVESLLSRYGSLVSEVLAPARHRPDLLDPVTGAPGHLRAEVLYAVTHEGALHLEDVLTRRTRVSVDTPDRGVAAAEHVAGLIGPELGWDAGRVTREVENYLARVHAELASQSAPDDRTANEVRTAVPEVTTALCG